MVKIWYLVEKIEIQLCPKFRVGTQSQNFSYQFNTVALVKIANMTKILTYHHFVDSKKYSCNSNFKYKYYFIRSQNFLLKKICIRLKFDEQP